MTEAQMIELIAKHRLEVSWSDAKVMIFASGAPNRFFNLPFTDKGPVEDLKEALNKYLTEVHK
jgi:hypothetical protein